MKVIKCEIENGDELREWATSEGWCIDGVIEALDNKNLWDEVFDIFECAEGETISETELNDFLRFGVEEFFPDLYEEDEEDEEDEESEE